MRRELRDAAARLFQQRGIKSVTLTDVAAEVGLSKAALYHYFDTKDDLILQIFAGWAETSLVPFKEIADLSLDPEAKLRRVIALQVEQVVSDSDLYILSVQEENNLPAHVREEFRRTKRVADHLVREIIEEGQESGVFDPIDSHLAEFALMGMCNWLWKWYDPAGPQTPAAIAAAFTRLMLYGLVPRDRGGEPGTADGLGVAEHLAAIDMHTQALKRLLDGHG
jgi:TetR/AcrR family transcriptional regulator, cholesterol catabolism regulator